MGKSITALLLAFLAAAALAQGDIGLQDNAPDRYIVERGDTLWDIAKKFLKDPWRWPEIWRLNQDQIRNPHRLRPGDVIVLDRRTSPPQLAVEDTVKLSPSIREEPVSQAIPAIPANVIEPFLTEPLVIEENGLQNAPRIVATEENRVNLGPGGVAYVRGLADSKQESWHVFRPGRPLVDPATNRTLGIEAVYLGLGRLVRQGDPATLQIVSARQEITSGDRLIAVNPPLATQYVPHAPTGLIEARIISLYDRLTTSEGGRHSVVSLNKGRRDGIENGHVLAVYRTGALVAQASSPDSRDKEAPVRLPDERYGLVFVFRTFDNVSYALVMESSRPVTSGDRVRTP
jgi:hypothetical protein